MKHVINTFLLGSTVAMLAVACEQPTGRGHKETKEKTTTESHDDGKTVQGEKSTVTTTRTTK